MRRETVSYLRVHFWPSGTEEPYRAMIKVLHPETGLPEGQCSHTSPPTEGGYLIPVVGARKSTARPSCRTRCFQRCLLTADSLGLRVRASLGSLTTIQSDPPKDPVFA